jgi:hypothetical protein
LISGSETLRDDRIPHQRNPAPTARLGTHRRAQAGPRRDGRSVGLACISNSSGARAIPASARRRLRRHTALCCRSQAGRGPCSLPRVSEARCGTPTAVFRGSESAADPDPHFAPSFRQHRRTEPRKPGRYDHAIEDGVIDRFPDRGQLGRVQDTGSLRDQTARVGAHDESREPGDDENGARKRLPNLGQSHATTVRRCLIPGQSFGSCRER